MITTTAWKYFKTPEKITYCVQFDKVPKRWKTKLHRMLRGWQEFSIGFGSEYNTFVFKKDFKDSQDWLKWIKKFPYQGGFPCKHAFLSKCAKPQVLYFYTFPGS